MILLFIFFFFEIINIQYCFVVYFCIYKKSRRYVLHHNIYCSYAIAFTVAFSRCFLFK